MIQSRMYQIFTYTGSFKVACAPLHPPPPPYYPTHGRGYIHVQHGSMLSLCVLLKLLWFLSRREKLAKARNNS